MGYKGSQFNFLIEEIVKLMDNDTILICTSDHGMTPDGMHGGDTLEETESFFFAYTKRGFMDEVFDPKYKNLMAKSRKEMLT